MNLFNFSIARLPRIIFSRGAIKQIPEFCLQYGTHVLLVTGARSFESSDGFVKLKKDFKKITFSLKNIPSLVNLRPILSIKR